MKPAAHIVRLNLLATAFHCAAATGCRRESPTSPASKSHLALLASGFIIHANSHQGRPPRDESAFKGFLTSKGSAVLELADVTNVADLFVSERDGQPLVFMYETGKAPHLQSGVVGYEAEGVDGVRLVAFRDGTIRQLSEQEFQSLR